MAEANSEATGGLDFKAKIRSVHNFPKAGVNFRDITTLIKDPQAFNQVITSLAEPFRGKADVVAGIEARGFIIGGAVAHELGLGFVPLRKPGKLPGRKLRAEYSLEYGMDALEVHEDAIFQGQRVLLVDDLLATGGTASAAKELVEKLGGKLVAFAFLIELSSLKGRKKLGDTAIHSLVTYDEE